MFSISLQFLLVISAILAITIDGYKVLIFSQTLTRSHMMLNARVAETLAADGHNVTVVEVEYLEPLTNFTGSVAKGVRKISVSGDFLPIGKEMWGQLLRGTLKPWTFWKVLEDAVRSRNYDLQRLFNSACETFIDAHGELLEALKAEQFELFIGGQINFCGSGLSQLLNIPVHVLLVSCPIQEHVSLVLGLHSPSSYVPSIYGMAYTDKMSLFERFGNLIAQMIYEDAFLYGMDDLTARLRRRFGDRLQSVRDIVKESPLVFVNVDEFSDFPRPLFPNVIYIGGLEFEGTPETKALQEPYKSEMEKGRRGVVFFSMGSAVRTNVLPESFMQNDEDELSKKLAENIPNVHLTPWAPQRAILAHPRLRLFITHGGYNSLLEGAQSGSPVLSIGFFADQRRNARVPQRNGWGQAFENWKLLEGSGEFKETVRAMLEDNDRFRSAANRLKRILAMKPFTAREKLTKYIRFLEQNGGKLPELLPQARNLTWTELYGIDLALLMDHSKGLPTNEEAEEGLNWLAKRRAIRGAELACQKKGNQRD
uniref:glucuronosyltransferase n=1 Tax=Globodera rostochiensis TaxID=31243 RepID=A0A914H7H1_GLORO